MFFNKTVLSSLLSYVFEMDKFGNRIKLDVFKSETTYQNSYKVPEPVPVTITDKDCLLISPEPKVKPPAKLVLRDHETFMQWREEVKIPINLLWTQKEIISTNPHEPFTRPIIPEDTEKEDVIKTRPRIYMTPAVSMDDIPDKKTRNLLVDFMYTTDWKKATQESKVKVVEKEIPNCTVEIEGDPVRLKIDLLKPLPENFRNKGKKWENAQEKASVDPIKSFWQHKDPPVKCGACVNPVEGLVPEETKQQISELIASDRLRLPHDAPIPGYAGYKPRLSYGVSLAKSDLPVVHPLLSVTQAITKRYEKNKAQ